ncbi:DUF3331 domain-containing protein [Paraburkholderia hiiakae]
MKRVPAKLFHRHSTLDNQHFTSEVKVDSCYVWERIIAPLLGTPIVCELAVRKTARPTGAFRLVGNCIAVHSVERQSDRSMLVSWSDSTLGHFADQRWVGSKSRHKGRCALSGCLIRRGDPIYRPQRRGLVCLSFGPEMILARVLESMV